MNEKDTRNLSEHDHSEKAILAAIWSGLRKEDTIRSLDLGSISIALKSGRVELSGHVSRSAHRTRMEEIALSIPGVASVENQLITDHDLKIEVAQLLGSHPSIRTHIISVGAFHGWLHLGGVVPTSEVQAAIEVTAAGHPRGRGILTLPRIEGLEPVERRRPHQPQPGSAVYASDGLVGRSGSVIVDPRNRLVSHILVRSTGETAERQKDSEFVVPANQIDLVRNRSIFLAGNQREFFKLPEFQLEEFPCAPPDWSPPYPYSIGQVHWPREAADDAGVAE